MITQSIARRWKRDLKTVTTLQDDPCPACSFPETLVIREQGTLQPVAFRCPKCGWYETAQAKVPA